jgi:hypothetical protein
MKTDNMIYGPNPYDVEPIAAVETTKAKKWRKSSVQDFLNLSDDVMAEIDAKVASGRDKEPDIHWSFSTRAAKVDMGRVYAELKQAGAYMPTAKILVQVKRRGRLRIVVTAAK